MYSLSPNMLALQLTYGSHRQMVVTLLRFISTVFVLKVLSMVLNETFLSYE